MDAPMVVDISGIIAKRDALLKQHEFDRKERIRCHKAGLPMPKYPPMTIEELHEQLSLLS